MLFTSILLSHIKEIRKSHNGDISYKNIVKHEILKFQKEYFTICIYIFKGEKRFFHS